jgi:hypothetical protein
MANQEPAVSRYNQDDDETRNLPRHQSGEYGPETYGFRLDRIERQQGEEDRKLDHLIRLCTVQVERQATHEARLTSIERGAFKVLWTALLSLAGAIGSLLLGLLSHTDKVAPK